MPQLKETPDYLRVGTAMGREIKVDRAAGMLRGYAVAQEGSFKNKDRGAFDLQSLKDIRALMNKSPKGLKSRFSHPTLSGDGLGKYLGRGINPSIEPMEIGGKLLHVVRADLVFNQTALEEPPGGGKPLGVYIMDLAESDPDALSSSLVVGGRKEVPQLDANKRPMLDEGGAPLGPIWRPTALHASDIVDTGEAVDGLLSAEGLSIDGLPDELVRRCSQLLSSSFANATREVVKARATAWLENYLAYRFGDELAEEVTAEIVNTGQVNRLRKRLELMEGG